MDVVPGAMNDRFDREIDLGRLPYRDPAREAANAALLKGGAPIRVYVDDERVPARDPGTWIVVRSAYEAVRLLRAHTVAELSLDHDLGVAGLREQGYAEDVLQLVGEGYDVLAWLEARLIGAGDDRVPGRLNIHSGNPVGTRRMISAIRSIARRVPLQPTDPDGRSWERVPGFAASEVSGAG